ncbi:hypothetical protein V1J52_10970 [Streptomyces sp. TRM 70351]|uniref:TPR repeat region-containing protein n=1 Tax=Streptomyces sp. TRM 70351 TaxID=3116552 RepID=UPI002E7BE53D|nr:hypothetical protein [Streptomyces sp. TRM 70351]MEE1928712.1 hypothetical protein [Streptomyces sp. TRM 70351]
MSDEFTLTRSAVAEAAGCDPWELRETFKDETDVEAIDELRVIFRQAGKEAEESGDIAAYASQLEEDAGTSGPTALYDDAAEHLRDNHADLQGNGADFGEVAGVLAEVIERAEEVVGDVDDLADDLQADIDRLETKGNNEIGAAREKKAAMDELPYVPMKDGGGQVSYVVLERTFTISPSVFPLDDIIAHIKSTRTEHAGNYASACHGDMETELDGYYNFLRGREGYLSDLGYDAGGSPVNIWATEGRAAYEGERLQELFADGEPTPEQLERYTAGVGSILDRVHPPGGTPGEPARDLTPEEVAYLSAFYGALDAETLAALGEGVGTTSPGNERAQVERVEAAQAAVANGIQVLMDPTVGGIDPGSRFGRESVPDSISEFVYDYGETMSDTSSEPDAVLDAYNDFGALMGHATVPAGDSFSRDMAETAMTVQETVDRWNRNIANEYLGAERPIPDGLDLYENTGSSGLLIAVSRNGDTSAELLIDEEYRERVLGANWADSDGVADLIRGGTIPVEGQGGDHYTEAAFHVLEYAAGHHGMLGTDDPTDHSYDKVYPTDHTALQGAVADTTVAYLDLLARPQDTETQFDRGDGTFTFGHDDRGDLFSFLAKTEESVNAHFKEGVYNHQYQVAGQAFTDENANASERFTHISDVNAVVGMGEALALAELSGDADAQAQFAHKLVTSSVSAGLGVAAIPATGGASAGVALASTGYGFANGFYSGPKPEQPQVMADFQYTNELYGDWSMQHAVAAAAIDANASGDAVRYTLPDGAQLPGELPELDYTRADATAIRDELAALAGAEEGFGYATDFNTATARTPDLAQIDPNVNLNDLDSYTGESPVLNLDDD